jgi:hypothetical protein
MDFPLFIVCGTRGGSKSRQTSVVCPVCTRSTLVEVERWERCCICFIPLCKVGGTSRSARCGFCGSVLPTVLIDAPEVRPLPSAVTTTATPAMTGAGAGGATGMGAYAAKTSKGV